MVFNLKAQAMKRLYTKHLGMPGLIYSCFWALRGPIDLEFSNVPNLAHAFTFESTRCKAHRIIHKIIFTLVPICCPIWSKGETDWENKPCELFFISSSRYETLVKKRLVDLTTNDLDYLYESSNVETQREHLKNI